MINTLLLALPEDNTLPPSWLMLPEGPFIQQGHPTELASLAAQGHKVIVIVPARDVLLLSATFPNKLSAARVKQMLPYALEEQLIDDIETLHFALLGKQQPDHRCFVAIVSHDKMRAWQQQLNVWHVHSDQWIPASLALPYQPTHGTAVVTETYCMMRTGDYEGIAIDSAHLTALFPAIIQKIPGLQLTIYNYTSTTVLNQVPTTLPIKITEHCSPADKPLILIKQAILSGQSSQCNLLQGPYLKQSSLFPTLPKFLPFIRYTSFALISLFLLKSIISYAILKHYDTRLNQQLLSRYQYYFPTDTDYPILMKQKRLQIKLQSLIQTKVDPALLVLAKIGNSLSQEPRITLQQIHYQNNQATVTLVAPSSAIIQSFTHHLMQQALMVQQQQVVLTDTALQITLVIEPTTS